jgi:3-deoxy-7-phosphoheptulonate synthase
VKCGPDLAADDLLRLIDALDPHNRTGKLVLIGRFGARRIVDAFFAIARAEGVAPGGLHLEMSALDVTECLGGRGPASLDELERNWLTACDPRLNAAQAIDLAGHVAALLA